MNFGDPDTLSVETRLLMPRDRFVQPYACCLFGIDKILVGGSNPNCLRIIDRNINPNSQQVCFDRSNYSADVDIFSFYSAHICLNQATPDNFLIKFLPLFKEFRHYSRKILATFDIEGSILKFTERKSSI